MDIVTLSDTHNNHHKVIVPKGDMLLYAGDLTKRGTKNEVLSFLKWFSKQPHKYKIFIAGNHDFFFDYNWKAITKIGAERHAHKVSTEEDVKEMLSKFPNLIYLNDSGVEIEGIKIWGSPVQLWYNDWGFNRKSGGEIKKHWDLIPLDTDILITHSPAYKILDDIPQLSLNVGCKDLKRKIKDLKNMKLHVCGHIHESAGMKKISKKIHINSSFYDAYNMCYHQPLTITI